MAKIHDLMQNRAVLTESMRAMMDKYDGAEMIADDKTAFAKMEADFDGINARINAEQKQLDRERAIGEKAPSAAKDNDPKKAEIMGAFRNVLTIGSQQAVQIYAAMQQDNPTQSGYLVAPEKFVNELIKDLADATFMRQEATVKPPLTGAISLGYPTQTDDMADGEWGTEISTAATATSAKVGKREFKPRPHTALDKISKTLVRNMQGADAYVRGEFAAYYAKACETAYMTGDGANRPLGLFTASADGINTDRDVSTGNTATEVKFDGLIEAKFAVKTQYQANAKWLFNPELVKQLAKLKNSDGQYVWQPSIVMGTPDMLFGRPVLMSEYVPHVFTTGLYVGIYGDLKNYWIVDSLAFEIQVLMELYAATNQIGYIGRLETDGQPVRPNAFARVKLA